MPRLNEYGLTLEEWMAAATWNVPADRRVPEEQGRHAWAAGEDPTEYCAAGQGKGLIVRKNVTDAAMAILAQMKADGRVLRPATDEDGKIVMVDRKLYEEVDRVLQSLGGKWDRRAKGHVFPEGADVAGLVEGVIATGDFSCRKTADQLLGFFQTPATLATELAAEVAARVGPDDAVLEPSAGEGRLAIALTLAGVGFDQIVCIEIDQARAEKLRGLGFFAYGWNFLEMAKPTAHGYRAILMNPPFNRGADVHHVARALDWLEASTAFRGGGCLRAIMGAGITFRQDRATRNLRARLEALGATITHLPDGTFAPEGTNVRAVVVRLG